MIYVIRNSLIILLLAISSCHLDNKKRYPNITNLEDINEEFIKLFYQNVLDTLIDNYILVNDPCSFPIFDEDLDFFEEQLLNSSHFRWNQILDEESVISDNQFQVIRKSSSYKGIENFCIDNECEGVCWISIPFFSKDFKNIFIVFEIFDIGREIIKYEILNEELVLVSRKRISVC